MYQEDQERCNCSQNGKVVDADERMHSLSDDPDGSVRSCRREGPYDSAHDGNGPFPWRSGHGIKYPSGDVFRADLVGRAGGNTRSRR